MYYLINGLYIYSIYIYYISPNCIYKEYCQRVYWGFCSTYMYQVLPARG